MEDSSTAVVTVSDVSKRGKEDSIQIVVGESTTAGQLRNGNVRIGRRGKGCDDAVVL